MRPGSLWSCALAIRRMLAADSIDSFAMRSNAKWSHWAPLGTMLRQASDARPASTVTRTGKVASKQLAEAQQVAERGEDTEYGRKAPAADRLVEISEGFREQAGEKMGKAVSITREAFIRRRQKASTSEEAELLHAELRELGEQGKIAVRNARRKQIQQLGRLQRDARLSSDEQHAIQGHIEDMTDRHIADLDGLVEEKAKDLCKP